MTEPASPTQCLKWNIFADTKSVGLTRYEERKVLPLLTEFLKKNELRAGSVLLGAESGPWQLTEVCTLESRILESCNDLQVRNFLRLLRKFALGWSSVTRVPVELPRIPAPQYQYKNPFSQDTSARLREYDDAKELLAKWLEELCQTPKLPGEYE